MAQPTARDLHVDRLLTNISIRYKNPRYIADELFPIVPVEKQSDIVPKYNQSFWFRDDAKLRAPGTKSERGGWTVDNTDTYFCNRYSFGQEIPDQARENADQPYNLDRDASEFVADKAQMRREVNFAGTFFTTGQWGADEVGGSDFTQWSNYGGSNPLVDVATYKDAVEGKIGVEPNRMVIGKQVWLQLKWHPDLIDTIKYTQKGQLTEELVAGLFELDPGEFKIGRAIYTTDPEGTAESSVTYTRIWGKHALFLYTPGRPSLLTPSAGYTFVWQIVPAAIQYVKRMRDEEREVDIVEGNSYFAQHITASRAGIFLQNAVA